MTPKYLPSNDQIRKVCDGSQTCADRLAMFARREPDPVLAAELHSAGLSIASAQHRLRAELLRRVNSIEEVAVLTEHSLAPVTVGVLTIDPSSRVVRVRGVDVVCSKLEFKLLLVLAREPTRVFTKEALLRDIWGFKSAGTTRTLDSHACRLRGKLAEASGGVRLIVNVWGVGYRLTDAVEGPRAVPDAEAA